LRLNDETNSDLFDEAAFESYGGEIVNKRTKYIKANVPLGKMTEIADSINGISNVELPGKLVPPTE
jgi:hypothetical protein